MLTLKLTGQCCSFTPLRELDELICYSWLADKPVRMLCFVGFFFFFIVFILSYIWVFFPLFPETSFFIVWTYDLVLMYSVAQAGKLVIIPSCSFLNHGNSQICNLLPPSLQRYGHFWYSTTLLFCHSTLEILRKGPRKDPSFLIPTQSG